MRFSSWTGTIFILLLLSLSVPTPVLADSSSFIEQVARAKCADARTSGSYYVARYTEWMNNKLKDAFREFLSAKTAVREVSNKLKASTEKYKDKEKEIGIVNEEENYDLAMRKKFTDFVKSTTEANRLTTDELPNAPTEIEKRRIEREIEKNKKEAIMLGKELIEMNEAEQGKTLAAKYGSSFTPQQEFSRRIKKMSEKKEQLQEDLKKIGADVYIETSELMVAWDNYKEARDILAALREINKRIKQCLSERPDVGGTLSAYWRGQGVDRNNPLDRLCISGTFRINFDERGRAVDGVLKVDCSILYGGSEILENCPPDPGRFADMSIYNIQADMQTGRISFQYGTRDRSTTISGSFRRSGDRPPYSYTGSGRLQAPITDSMRGEYIWRTTQALSCR